MRLSSMMLLAALAATAVGCANGPTHWIRRLPNGDEFLVTGCDYPETCREAPGARLTNDPIDREAWKYEADVILRGGFGISYGRSTADRIVVGPRERCEQVRQQEEAQGTPTRPCQGPLRFTFL